MRGKAVVLHQRCSPMRITPAYAGKSCGRELLLIVSRDHPRVCGEKLVYNVLYYACKGSPPRMRGKETGKTRRVQWPGITPAYAGKSIFQPYHFTCTRDHPRVCGEKFQGYYIRTDFPGSPPRMRGKAVFCGFPPGDVGITPAYAGKSHRLALSRRVPWDHPRVCGEKCTVLTCTACGWGSPPRMRGKGAPAGVLARWSRITPAYAGKRKYSPVWLLVTWITPAYAGKRELYRKSEKFVRDHPRVCGEKTKKIP